MKKKNASALVYLIFFITVFLAFCAFAVDATIVYTIREKLQNATEATALAAASYFNNKTTVTVGDITGKATQTFNLLKADSLQYAHITTEVDLTNKQVHVTTQMNAPTFFLAFLGVSGINLNASAYAASETLSVTKDYLGTINWITASAAYRSDIISKGINLNDTAILTPIGNFLSASYNKDGGVMFGLIEKGGSALSLGPGGFITIKLPAPIIDKPGDDLHIVEANVANGAYEGYMVFAGLDNNPLKPYVDKDTPGDGLKWVNISCTGTPDIIDNGVLGAYSFDTQGSLGFQTKFYGSGKFDIGASCSDGSFKGISMAKYIRIIDDNDESAAVTNTIAPIDPNTYYQAMLYGESSSATAGADIDYVEVLNHVRLKEKPLIFIPN